MVSDHVNFLCLFINHLSFTELPFKFTSPNRYVFKGAEVNFSDDDDEDEENDEEDEKDNEHNDSENESETETNTNENNLNVASDESVLETSADTSSPMSDKCIDNDNDKTGTLYLHEKVVDTTNLPLEHGVAKLILSPIHSSSDCAYPSREKKEKRESIENYSPNSF